MMKRKKRRERKKWRKNDFFIIHYFEQIDQYRIERPTNITGGLKSVNFVFSRKTLLYWGHYQNIFVKHF